MGMENVETEENTSVQKLVDYIEKEIESGRDPYTLPEFIRDPQENPITSDDLFELLRLPVEIGLSEEDGKVILTIGEQGKINDQEFVQRSNANRLCLHSHPPNEKTNSESSISVGDIIRVNARDGKMSLLLHTDGIIVYGDATKNPLTGETLGPLPDNRDILNSFLKSKGYSILGDDNFSSIGTVKQLEISNEFAEKSGMIRERISWNDTNGMEKILDMVNLKSEN